MSPGTKHSGATHTGTTHPGTKHPSSNHPGIKHTVVPEELEGTLKALASERRLQILEWLKDPVGNFPPQEHGDPVEHGACNLFIVDKLGVSQPAASRHLKVLVDAGFVIATRRKGWTYYRRNEPRIAAVAALVADI